MGIFSIKFEAGNLIHEVPVSANSKKEALDKLKQDFPHAGKPRFTRCS